MENQKVGYYYDMTESYQNLVAGIVEQAVKDYRHRLSTGNKATIRAMERWFLSDWGQMLSLGNGELIIKRVKDEMCATE